MMTWFDAYDSAISEMRVEGFWFNTEVNRLYVLMAGDNEWQLVRKDRKNLSLDDLLVPWRIPVDPVTRRA